MRVSVDATQAGITLSLRLTRPVFILSSRLCPRCPLRARSQFIKLRRSPPRRRLRQNGSAVSLPGCNCVFHFQQLGDELLMRLMVSGICVCELTVWESKEQTTPSAAACHRGQRSIKDLELMNDERLLSLLQQLLVPFYLS